MMKYNSKIFARSICAVMAGVMMAGGLVGCTHGDSAKERNTRLEKQNGDKAKTGEKTEIAEIAEKYREKESQQIKRSLQDNGWDSLLGGESDSVMYEEEYCD